MRTSYRSKKNAGIKGRMSLTTGLKGRLRNTNLPKSHALFPLYEAVVNSIHSIDERIKNDKEFEISKAYIKVKIIRSAQKSLDNSKSDITGFEIVDNGIGLNSKNYESFPQILDSEYKKSLIHECVTGKRRITEKMLMEVR